MLDSRAKKYLRGRAHALKPVVLIGKDGVTDAIAAEIERTAGDVELVKIRLLGNAPLDAAAAQDALSRRLRGEVVGRIGHVLIYFLPGKEPTRYPLPSPPREGATDSER